MNKDKIISVRVNPVTFSKIEKIIETFEKDVHVDMNVSSVIRVAVEEYYSKYFWEEELFTLLHLFHINFPLIFR